MGTFKKGMTCLLLMASAASSMLTFNAQAESDGTIVLTRDVQPVHFGRNGGKDPNPTTVSANPSARVNSVLNSTELSDGDFANIASGKSIAVNNINKNNPGFQGLNTVTNPNGMPGMGSGHQGGSGNAISGTINRAMSSGLAPLGRLAGGQ